MLRYALLGTLLLATLLGPVPGSAFSAAVTKHTIGLIRQDHTPLYSRASTRSAVLVRLVQQTQARILRKSGGWSYVQIWAAVKGWLLTRDLVFRKPWESPSTYQAPGQKHSVHAHGPTAIKVRATVVTPVTVSSSRAGVAATTLSAGSSVVITAWKQDKRGRIWYQVAGRWARGEAFRFASSDPGLTQIRGVPLWHAVSGKGMWLTLGTVPNASPDLVIRAAMKHGITHLYVEAAISPLGFHGKPFLGPLVDAAHRNHIAVLAWVFPYLDDIAQDVTLTRAVAAFRSASGERLDGIAADIEHNMDLPHIRAYSQLIRYYLGPSFLLVGVTYPPESIPTFPFWEVAHYYNAIAPMDYWHQTKTSRGLDFGHMQYGYAYARRYGLESVLIIRRQSGHVPVTAVGQTFDDFGRLEMGPHAPSEAEVRGFLQGTKDAGAIGTSFFQWMTATDGEWRAIHGFRF